MVTKFSRIQAFYYKLLEKIEQMTLEYDPEEKLILLDDISDIAYFLHKQIKSYTPESELETIKIQKMLVKIKEYCNV